MKNSSSQISLWKPLNERVSTILALFMSLFMLSFLGFAFSTANYYPYRPTPLDAVFPIVSAVTWVSFAVLCLQNLTDRVRADAQGIHQRKRFKGHFVRWAEVGAYFSGEFNLILFDRSQTQILMQLDMSAQWEASEWPNHSRAEFERFVNARLAEHHAEPLSILPFRSSEHLFHPAERNSTSRSR